MSPLSVLSSRNTCSTVSILTRSVWVWVEQCLCTYVIIKVRTNSSVWYTSAPYETPDLYERVYTLCDKHCVILVWGRDYHVAMFRSEQLILRAFSYVNNNVMRKNGKSQKSYRGCSVERKMTSRCSEKIKSFIVPQCNLGSIVAVQLRQQSHASYTYSLW